MKAKDKEDNDEDEAQPCDRMRGGNVLADVIEEDKEDESEICKGVGANAGEDITFS